MYTYPPLRYAVEILGVYTDIVDEMMSKQCSVCLNTEQTIEAQVLAAHSQNYAGEVAYVVLSVLQARPLVADVLFPRSVLLECCFVVRLLFCWAVY